MGGLWHGFLMAASTGANLPARKIALD